MALRLWQVLRPRLRFNGALALYEQLERDLLPVLLDMERAGIKVDAADLQRMSVDFEQRMATIEMEIHRLAGRAFNVGSAKELGEVLFDEMKLGGSKRMKTGAWGTDASVLQTLAEQGHELPARILDWRQLQKLKSTYAYFLVGEINPGTPLGCTQATRSASHQPGGCHRTIPICRTFPYAPKKAAVFAAPLWPSQGMVLVSADDPQIQLRLLAHVADIPPLRESFLRGGIHSIRSQAFCIPIAGMAFFTNAPARQGHQLPYHLRHQWLRVVRAVPHITPGEARTISMRISSVTPASAPIWTV